MVFRLLADLVVAVHFGYFVYLLGGGFLAWRWPRTFVLHVATVLWAALSVAGLVGCPLTALQNELRVRGGEHPLPAGFMDRYMRGVFYPADHEWVAQVAVVVLVLVSWAGVLVRRRRALVRTRRPRRWPRSR